MTRITMIFLAAVALAAVAAEPKPDDKLLKPVATSLPIKYKGDGVALSAEYSPTALVVCTVPKPYSNDYTFEVYDPKTCKRSHTFQVGGKSPIKTMAISPGGTRLAILEGSDDKVPEISVWTVSDGKELRKRWSPANSKSGFTAETRSTQVIWLSFITEDKLLTVTEGGQIASWAMTGEKPAYEEQLLDADKKQTLRSHTHYPVPGNFVFSLDRATLAIQQNVGVTLVDTATGRTTGKLPTPTDTARFLSIDGLAFRPDGKKLSACYAFSAALDSKTPKRQDKRIVIWDIAAKRVDVEAPLLPHYNSGSHWTWWGDRHLIWHYGNSQCFVVRADTGAVIRDCLPPEQHSTTGSTLVGGAADGRLRYLTNAFTTNYLVYDAPSEQLDSDTVVDDGKGFFKRIQLTTTGVEKMPADAIGTTRKFEIPKR